MPARWRPTSVIAVSKTSQLYRVEIHRAGLAWDGSEGRSEGGRNTATTFNWPRANDPLDPDNLRPAWLPPRGIVHQYAPLAAPRFDNNGTFDTASFTDLRRRLPKLWE